MSDNRLAQAQQALQAGNLEMAESLYSTLLQDLPTADVYYGLGLIAHKKNLHQEALIWIEQAILLSPDNALFWFGKAVVLFEDGVYAEAIDSFEKVLALNPDSFPVYFILAGAYAKEGLLDKAERAYQVLLSQEPTHMDALNNLGNIYLQKKYLKKAIRCFKKALDIQNTYAKVHNNLGTLYLNYGKPQKALSYFRDAIRYQPDQAYFYNNLANALKQLGLSDEAIENYEYAIQLNPAYVSAYRNLALLYRENFQYEQALTLLHKALSFKVDVQVLIELGDVSLSMGQVEQAIEYYDKAYSLEPKVSIQFKLARILPCIYRSIEDVYFWRQRFERSYESLKQQNLKLSDPIGEIGAANFYLAYQGLNNCSTYKTVGEVFLNALELKKVHFFRNAKPRIGFFSAHFKKSHTILKFYSGILNKLSREKFDVYIYGCRGSEQLPIQTEHQYTNFKINKLDSICRKIASDRLDVLFYSDIGMEPISYFLAYNRLAPVQCLSWGHPETSGIPNLDYFISSHLIETEDSQNHYSEKLVRLSTMPTYYYTPEKLISSYDREYYGFSSDMNLYLCPQSLFKFHPDFDAILAGILRQDSKGRLILVNSHVSYWQSLLQARFQNVMPDVADRIIFLNKLSEQEFLGLLALGDVVLDTLHFGGGNTTYETLFQGAPIVTFPQPYMKSRITYGCYQKMGMMECAVASSAEYIEKATRIGTDKGYRSLLSEKILSNNHVLFEDHKVIDELETFFMEALETANLLKVMP